MLMKMGSKNMLLLIRNVTLNYLPRVFKHRPRLLLGINKADSFERNFCSFQYDSCRPLPSVFSRGAISVQNNLISRRYKKRKANKNPKEEEEEGANEEENDEDDVENENPLLMEDIFDSTADGSQQTIVDVGSLRLDSFAKVVFSVPRARVEEAFYKGELYVNGEKPLKKSCDLSIGDEIDLVKNIDPEDHTLVHVKRVQILKLPDKASDQGRMKITIKRWQDLVINAHGISED